MDPLNLPDLALLAVLVLLGIVLWPDRDD